MDDRSRQRRGNQASIAGAEADQVVQALIQQFSDPHAFVRELIQNSLDAGAVRIDVEMTFADGELAIVVRDDGEGMDRATIEGYLLVKFRSTKERDLTKIGKFGIGFVSLFALQPSSVVVDTGRDGIWHRVAFTADLSYTLSLMPDPFEGTTVTIVLPRSRSAAQEDAERVRDRAAAWCRFADADIRTCARGLPAGWENGTIRASFEIDGPITVRDEGDAFVAVLAPAVGEPHVGFYNRGLTLLEQRAALVPGVSFRVDDRLLEHTLTRDNVIRDAHFERVLARVHAVAAGPLGDAVHLEAGQAARSGDLDRVRALWRAIDEVVPWTWRADLPLIPAVGHEPVSLGLVEGSRFAALFGWNREIVVGLPDDPLAIEVARSGQLVIAGTADDPHVVFLVRRGATVVPVAKRWRTAVRSPAGDALAEATTPLVIGAVIASGRLIGGPADALAYVAADPFAAARLDQRDADANVVAVNVEHPLVERLLTLPPGLAAPLLVRLLAIEHGVPALPLPELIAAAVVACR